MSRLLNALKTHAASMDAAAPVGRWGVVNGANGATVKVLLQPENVQTDWLPLASSMVGGGWGLVHMPPNGTQVFCMPDAGDHDSYVVIGATWSTANQPPAGVAQGEFWLVHSTGSSIKLTNDGKVTITDHSGTSLAFTNNGIVTLTGIFAVTGSITVNGTTVAVP
jgi:phage baseplate assembly protein V